MYKACRGTELLEKVNEDKAKFQPLERLAKKLASQPKLRYKKPNTTQKMEYSIVDYYPKGE